MEQKGQFISAKNWPTVYSCQLPANAIRPHAKWRLWNRVRCEGIRGDALLFKDLKHFTLRQVTSLTCGGGNCGQVRLHKCANFI